jgi:hypothetical protein
MHARYNAIVPEPNNMDNPPELCAGANFSQVYGALNAWGWSDANCSIAAPFMCKLLNPRGIFRWAHLPAACRGLGTRDQAPGLLPVLARTRKAVWCQQDRALHCQQDRALHCLCV